MCNYDGVDDRGNPRLRWADRHLGPPVLATLGRFRRRRSRPGRVRRIGLLKLTAIGDTVLLSAAIADLAAAFPRADLVFLTGRENAAVAALVEGPHDVVTLDAARPWRAIGELRRLRLDVLVDCGSWSRLEATLTALAGPVFTVWFRTPGQARHACQDASVDHSDEVHELVNYRRLLGALGVEGSAAPQLLPPGELADGDRPAGPYAVLHPWPNGYRRHLKEWPEARWVELAQRMSASGLDLVLTGGPADARRSGALATACAAAGTSAMDLAGQLRLGEVLDLLAEAECVISVNTGIMHMAAACGAPTVALNGPTSERRWGPVGPRTISVNSTYEGCGYLHLGSEYEGRRQDCMEGISVDAVVDAAAAVMRTAPAVPRQAVGTSPGSRRVG
jgi:heptosyltransferase I